MRLARCRRPTRGSPPLGRRLMKRVFQRGPLTAPLLPQPTRRQALTLLALLMGGIVVSLVADRLLGHLVPLQPVALRDWFAGLGAWAAPAYVALMALAIVVTPIPSVPLDIAAGLAFGVFWGTIYTLIGAQLGATICFVLARRFGRGWLERRIGRSAMGHIDRMTERIGAPMLFLMRLLPVFNFDWVSYAAGLTPMSLRTFSAATFAGMLLPVIAIVAVGDALLTNPGQAALIFGGLVLLAVLPLGFWIVRPVKAMPEGEPKDVTAST